MVQSLWTAILILAHMSTVDAVAVHIQCMMVQSLRGTLLILAHMPTVDAVVVYIHSIDTGRYLAMSSHVGSRGSCYSLAQL